MNIKINRAREIKPSLSYNFEKCDMSAEDLKEKDIDKYEQLISSGKLSVHDPIATLLDDNLPPSFKTLERASHYMEAICDRAENNLNLRCAHIKVSFHPDEEVDDSKIIDIGQDVLSELGFLNTPYCLFVHRDEPHSHFHTVTTTVKKDRSHVSSSFEGLSSNKLEEKLEEKYGLIKKRDHIKEVDGLKTRSWKENKISQKTGHDTHKNVIRQTVNDCFDENMDLNLFARSLSRAGIGLYISKFRTKDMQTKYGLSYTLHPDKIRFRFSDSINTMPQKFQGYDVEESVFKKYLSGQTDSIIVQKDNGEDEYTFSKNFLNEIYISDSPLVHPPISDLKNISIKGTEVGSKFSFYGLGFSDVEAEIYRGRGNDNSLVDERPEESKLLYSLQRGKLDCVREAFEEGASLSLVEDNHKDYLLENYPDVWHYLVEFERGIKEKTRKNSLSPQKDASRFFENEKNVENQKSSGWKFGR
jgi:hypothetical protein